MKIKSKNLYIELFEKRWTDPDYFLQCVLDENHPLWGSGGAGREFAKEILTYDSQWEWLSYRVDDFAGLIEVSMRKKLSYWIWRSNFDVGGLYRHNSSTANVAKWLLDRYVAELKNLFDKRYDGHIKINQCMLIQLNDRLAI